MEDDTKRSSKCRIEIADCMTGVESWEEWEEEVGVEQRMLWKMLEECDREQAKEEKKKVQKKIKKIQQASVRMGVGKTNPASWRN